MSARQLIRSCAVVVTMLCWTTVSRAQVQDVECGLMPEVDTAAQCPRKGGCDHASERDLWDENRLSADQNKLRVRVWMTVFGDPQQSGLSDADVNDQIEKLEGDMGVYNIVPVVNWQRVLDTTYYVVDTEQEVDDMKNLYANSPATQLNVYVTDFDLGFGGRGYYPWGSEALNNGGGIMIDISKFGDERTTFTHELGHNLGLWHTYHGNDIAELDFHGGGCGITNAPCECHCHEPVVGPPNCNTVGDFCCDTAATPSTATRTACSTSVSRSSSAPAACHVPRRSVRRGTPSVPARPKAERSREQGQGAPPRTAASLRNERNDRCTADPVGRVVSASWTQG